MFNFLRPWRRLKLPLYLIIGALFLGALGFKFFFPEESFLRLLYMTGITLTTVGYGDILGVEHSSTGAIIYTLAIMITGMGVVLYSTSLVTAYIVEGNLRNAFSLERVRRRIRKMENHFIICGAGETGIHVIQDLIEAKLPCVVIENSFEKKEELLEIFPQLSIIVGDATFDHVLEEAGIEKAKGVVATLSNDKDNLYLTVSAKMLRPGITIVARAVELTMIKKLKRAGASRVVSPNFLGGRQIAAEILRPNVTSFFERIFRGEEDSIRFEEVVIPARSFVIGKTLQKINIFDSCGINIMAIGRGHDQYIYNPGPEFVLEENDVLLYIATVEQERKLEELICN